MSYYNDVYLQRLNRYGIDYASRKQGQRERVFEDLLLKSTYRVDFMYDGVEHPGLLEKYQQDDTKTIQYLLTRVGLMMPNGTILEIDDKDGNPVNWMVFYLESIEASGYNRYFVLRMTHIVTWYINNNFQSTAVSSLGYLYGPHNAALTFSNENGNQGSIPFFENNNSYYIIMPSRADLEKDNYFELVSEDVTGTTYTESYRIEGIDRQTNPGVQYVTIDPIYKYDKTAAPTKPEGSTDPAYDWFTGDFGGES